MDNKQTKKIKYNLHTSMDNNEHCSKCTDIFHEYCGKYITRYNYLGDLFIFFNILILLYILIIGKVNYDLVIKILLIGCCLFFFRGIVAGITICNADVNKDVRPWSSQHNDYWYIISGHTLNALLITYLIVKSKVHHIIKYASIILCVLVMFFQSCTREHYTCDIIITALIVHLIIKAYV